MWEVMLEVTPRARSQIKKELAPYVKDGKDLFVRLYMAVGWGGPNLQLALEESAQSDDQVVEVDDLKFLIGERDANFFKGHKLDYTKTFFNLGQFQLLRV